MKFIPTDEGIVSADKVVKIEFFRSPDTGKKNSRLTLLDGAQVECLPGYAETLANESCRGVLSAEPGWLLRELLHDPDTGTFESMDHDIIAWSVGPVWPTPITAAGSHESPSANVYVVSPSGAVYLQGEMSWPDWASARKFAHDRAVEKRGEGK